MQIKKAELFQSSAFYLVWFYLFYRNFVYTALVASTLKICGEIFIHNLFCHIIVYESSRHDKYVGIVVLTCKVSYLRYPAKCCTYALMLVERHAYAFSASAYSNAWVTFATFHSVSQSVTEVRIVATLCRESTEIFIFEAF